MSRAPVEFELYDADGIAHKYIVTPHPASEALKLVWRLIQAAATPLARLITAKENLPKLIEAFTSDGDEVELQSLLKKLDLDLSAASTDFFTVILATGEEWVTRELLNHTFRDNKSLKRGTRDGDFAFDQAYMANYGEMMEACVKSVKVNRFLSLFRSSLGSIVNIERGSGTEADTTESPALPEQPTSTG